MFANQKPNYYSQRLSSTNQKSLSVKDNITFDCELYKHMKQIMKIQKQTLKTAWQDASWNQLIMNKQLPKMYLIKKRYNGFTKYLTEEQVNMVIPILPQFVIALGQVNQIIYEVYQNGKKHAVFVSTNVRSIDQNFLLKFKKESAQNQAPNIKFEKQIQKQTNRKLRKVRRNVKIRVKKSRSTKQEKQNEKQKQLEPIIEKKLKIKQQGNVRIKKYRAKQKQKQQQNNNEKS